MKATSIEQIREHLARGGRVIGTKGEPGCWSTWEALSVKTLNTVMATCSDQTRGIPFSNLDWELLPIKEKPVVGKRISLSEAREIACKTMQDAEARRTIEPFSGRTPMGAVDELRRKLMFGHPWSMEEQRQVWELLTGERIEWGRRCNYCECSGKARKHVGNAQSAMVNCKLCQGSGYTVRPTWMGEVKG